MSDVGDYFLTLGTQMAAGLGATPDARAVFAEIACGVLHEVPAPPVDVLAMADWAAAQNPLPRQVNFRSGFGQPPLVVFEAPGFYIEVLFWFPSRTAIHGHGFTGAFRVLSGCSVQVEYRFEETSAPEPGVRYGRLEPRDLAMIGPGDVSAIEGHDEFIHTVAHLGQPSLTLVARTPGRKGVAQHAFYRCGFSHRSVHDEQTVSRQSDVLAAVFRARPAAFTGRLIQFLKRSDTILFVQVLHRLLSQLGVSDFSEHAMATVREEFGQSHARAIEAVEENVRRDTWWGLIRRMQEPRKQVMLTLSELFPDESERDRVICEARGVAEAQPVIDEWVRIAEPGLRRETRAKE